MSCDDGAARSMYVVSIWMVLIRDFAPARSRFGMNDGEMACAVPTIFFRALWLTFPDQLDGGSFAGG
jgi:hypothetical protein